MPDEKSATPPATGGPKETKANETAKARAAAKRDAPEGAVYEEVTPGGHDRGGPPIDPTRSPERPPNAYAPEQPGWEDNPEGMEGQTSITAPGPGWGEPTAEEADQPKETVTEVHGSQSRHDSRDHA